MSNEHYYTVIKNTPAGNILVIGSPKGISNVEFKVKSVKKSLDVFKKKNGFMLSSNNKYFTGAIKQLKEYFSGKRMKFDLKFDLSGVTDFRKKVYRNLLKVKAGKTITYGRLAEKSGGIKYSRAVGSAMASNPIPIIIPCHRVIKSDGSLGGFAGGLPLKRKLLNLEGVNF